MAGPAPATMPADRPGWPAAMGAGTPPPPHRAARQHQIVAVAVFEVPPVAEQMSRPVVHEQKFVAIGVAHQMIHRTVAAPQAQRHVAVAQHGGRLPRAGTGLRQQVQVEGTGLQLAVEARPIGRAMHVVEVATGAEEALLAHLAFIGALGQVGMSLAGMDALRLGVGDPAFHV